MKSSWQLEIALISLARWTISLPQSEKALWDSERGNAGVAVTAERRRRM